MGGLMMSTACSKDDTSDSGNNVTPKSATIKKVLEDEPQFERMNEAVEESNNSGFFSEASANITLFAASNAAWDEVFAEFNVSSMTELKSTMGEQRFSDFVLYHAINGNFNLDGFSDGFEETNAMNEDGDRLSVLVETSSSTSIMLNGGDDNGASNVGTGSISATNGSIIEVDAVLRAQSNLENMEEGESENALFLSLIADADASVSAMLDDMNEESTVLLMSDAQVETLLDIRLIDILDRDDFENLLDASAQSSLFTQFGVNTLDDLIANITLQSILDLNTVSMSDIFDEMESDDKAELVGSVILSGNYDKDAMMSAGSVTSEAGVVFAVSSNSSGQLVLTDSDNNQFILDGNSTTSANGSIFVTNSINK
jgi:uncharacterized surface protein with fasciclin (FAS1) repeats